MEEETKDTEAVDPDTGEILEERKANAYQPVLPFWSLEEIRARVQQVRAQMKEGTHFDKPMGRETGKDTLLKPGAELLAAEFQLRPSFRWERDSKKDHNGYLFTCTLIHFPSGVAVGQGLGYATTAEAKHAFRWESTGRPSSYGESPPEEGWKSRNLGGRWVWCRRVNNPDIADEINTVVKMGKKRSFVDAVLTACACSDMFTQDLEDHPHEPEGGTEPKAEPKATPKPPEEPKRRGRPPKAKETPPEVQETKEQIAAMVGDQDTGEPDAIESHQQMEYWCNAIEFCKTQDDLKALYDEMAAAKKGKKRMIPSHSAKVSETYKRKFGELFGKKE